MLNLVILKYIINFTKALRNKKDFQIYYSRILYKINYLLIKKNNADLPTIKKKILTFQIDITNDELKKIFSDLKNYKNYIFHEKSNKYLLYNYPTEFLKQVKYAWGFDRRYYVKFIKDKLDSKIKEIYNNNNYRIEHVWLYENMPNSKNLNEKLHIDNDMIGGLKCLIYLVDVDTDSGPFQFFDENNQTCKEIIGKKGTTVFFNQNEISHSNKKNNNKNRVILSFSIYPTLRNKIDYLENKPLNGLYTLNPFTKES